MPDFDNESFARRLGEIHSAAAAKLRTQAEQAAQELQAQANDFIRDLFGIPGETAPPGEKPAAPG